MAVRGALRPEAESFLHTQRLNFIELFYRSCITPVLELLFCPCVKSVGIPHQLSIEVLTFVNLQELT